MAYLQSLDGVGGGKILQVQHVQQTGGWSSTSNQKDTFLSKTITPGSTSNHILIQITSKYQYPAGSKTHGWCPSAIFRDTTNLGTGSPLISGAEYYMGDDTPQRNCAQYISIAHIDTVPAATEVTYHFKVGSNYGFAISMGTADMWLTEISGGVGD